MTVPRQYHTFQIHYLYKLFNYNDPNISAGTVTMDEKLPANAIPLPLSVLVLTAFNAGTTNTLVLGDGTTANRFALTTDTTLGTPAWYPNIKTNITRIGATPVDVILNYAQTGTAASAGQALIVFPYIPDQTVY